MRRPDGYDDRRQAPAAPTPDDEAVAPVTGIRRRVEIDEEQAAPAASRRWALRDAGEPEDDPEADAAEAAATKQRLTHAQQVDRAYRAAEKERRAAERAEAKQASQGARAATRARKRAERAEVRRFTASRRRQLRIALLTAGGLALALLLLVGLVWSPLMSVREVQVVGAERLDPAVVQEALADQVGQPIATVTEAGVAERLGAIPQIESYRVDVVPPSTVIVEVVERTPLAIVDGTVIDAAGVALGAADASTAGLPTLDGIAPGTPEFAAVATVLVSVPEEVLAATSSISAPTSSDIRLALASGQEVLWGGPEDSRLKADVVAALLSTQDPETARILDVRAPELPVVRGSATPGT